ncbi:MAG: helix-turn-helix domain-containing protein [Clostridia bacterium]|nr:helix-turn-helix domain-containing protein [Clostridia bacterium]
MKIRMVDSEVPYTVRLAIALKVNHGERFIFRTSKGNHTHSFIYVLEDRMEFSFPTLGKTLAAEKGQVLFIPKETAHSSIYKSAESTIVGFQFDLAEELPAQFKEPIFMPEDAAAYFRDFSGQHEPLDCLRCTARIYELLRLLLLERSNTPYKHRRLLPALNAIEKNPEARQSVAYYAQLCSMSESGFRRAFKNYTGQSPVEYRNTLRLQIARNLIQFSDYSVEEAAEHSGFTNLSFFYRLYRRTYGKKPGET